MVRYQIIRLVLLLLVTASCLACQKVISRSELMAIKWTHKPGEQLVASYEKTQNKHGCTGDPMIYLEEALFRPSKMVPGAQILNRFIYASCSPESITGTISRQVIYNGKVVLRDFTNHTFVPGTWRVNAYIQIPPNAPPGAYIFKLTITAGKQNFDKTFPFQIIQP